MDKSRSISFLGKRMASERIVWLPAADDLDFEISLDGQPVRVADRHGRERVRPRPRPDAPDRASLYRALRRRAGRLRRQYRRTVAGAAPVRGRRYRDAWVFIDRNRLAQDNAEHLYRYVKEHHRDVNAWFVIDRFTRDSTRLPTGGLPCRAVRHG